MIDKEVKTKHVQSLNSRDAVASFFSFLGYDVGERTEQRPENLGVTADSLKNSITHIENIATQEEQLRVLLVELKSVTVAHTRTLLNSLRNLAGDFLLVLTSDYEEIDFVLLQRIAPEDGGGRGQKQVKARPRVLTVQRRNPRRVALRVLRRLTYTETDPWAQYHKLVSAFDMAEWSEEHFDNRALFSDYYLKNRLRDRDEWEEDPRPAYMELSDLFERAASRWGGKNEAEVRGELLQPAFNALGYVAEEGKPPDDDSKEPDFLLYDRSDDETANPVCLCLTYAWGRSLDGKDHTRDSDTPEENPGTCVVSLLRSSDVPFAIVTNGKLWRLYTTKTHSMSSRFYQVDLPEILARDDPSEAFRYFWLIFRARAFTPRTSVIEGEKTETCFVESLIDGSRKYAQRLGERLKDRVFEDIFPHFAEGFIKHLCSQNGRTPIELNEDELDSVYQATLTFLYRLLFLLYAESRDLLPVGETRGYWDVSLSKMKQEVAERAGDLVDEVDGKIRAAYSDTETNLYDRLQELFRVIDEGDRSLNVPTYNGGLFITTPDEKNRSTESETAQFLADNAIPDSYLAQGLDCMARDKDEKTQALAFIDYKSLGVRQLGSIYEGLLEFKVRVAPEPLAVVKKKGSYRYKEYSELTKKEQEKLPKSRATTVQDGPREGDVYLENDKRERKATGSYYTPDHIVKYIISNTVGPVLEEKFKEVRPRIRRAQKAYSDLCTQTEVDENFTRQDAAREAFKNYQDVVDELFDVKVLDPAMGSGHFLVETVDFITDRMIDFLNAFPWNPVRELLERTRRTIQDEMDEQQVSIDPARLNDVNLMKRHVLKRCVYGVDVNPMAVELAKVSLWLDCFTLGAPLSFLDHHLRCGNSLVGTDVATVQRGVEGRKAGKVRQKSVFGSIFTGLEKATEAMTHVAELTDTTVKQVRDSVRHYKAAERLLDPYKGLLDVWVSEWFGNEDAQEAFRLFSQEIDRGIKAAVNNRQKPSQVSEDIWECVQDTIKVAEHNRFFHWELEFPEAWQGRVKKDTEPGFDVVVGNPPYDVLAKKELGYDVSEEIEFYKSQSVYEPAIRGKNNLYKLFVCRGVDVTRTGGMFAFIVPMALLGDDQAADVRRMLLENASFRFIEAFPQKDDRQRRVFPEAKLSTTMFVMRAQKSDAQFQSRTHPGRYVVNSSCALNIRPSELLLFDPENGVIPSCTQEDWDIAVKIISHAKMRRMGEYCTAFQGEVNETTDSRRGFVTKDPEDGLRVLRGSNICMYVVREASQGEPIYLRKDEYVKGKPGSAKAHHHEQTRIGWQESCPQNNFRRIIAAAISRGEFCNHKINYIPEEQCALPLNVLLALLNSKLLDWYFRLGSTNAAVSHYQIYNLPVPTLSETSPDSAWRELVRCGEWASLERELCRLCSDPGLMPKPVAEALAELSRRIQEIEGHRELHNRSERSQLAPESQRIQNVIDAVLFKCFGLSAKESIHIAERLNNML